MTLEELHNLVSELHERYGDATEVFIADHYSDLRKRTTTIIGHYEPQNDADLVLITGEKEDA